MTRTEPQRHGLLAAVVGVPTRALLGIVSAGVIVSLAVAAGGVWLQARLIRSRRR